MCILWSVSSSVSTYISFIYVLVREEAVILFILPHRVMPIEVAEPHITLDSVIWVLILVFSFSFLEVFLEFHQHL